MQACLCLSRYPCPASRIELLMTSGAKFYAYRRCRNAIWCRATSTTWSRRVSRKSVSIATCWAIFCCVCRVSPKPKVAWSWRRSRKLCLLRLSSEIGGQDSGGARKNHIVAVHQFGVRHRTQYLGNTIAGLAHDAASVGGRVIDEPAPALDAVLIYAGDDIAALKLAFHSHHAYGQQAFVPLRQRFYGAVVECDTAAQAQVVCQPALAGRTYWKYGAQFGTDGLTACQPKQHVGLTARGNDGVAAAIGGPRGSQNLGQHAAGADIAA